MFVRLLYPNGVKKEKFLDGQTTGPQGFSGKIGKLLETCDKLPVVKFQPIQGELPDVDVAVLSTDQKYLYQACHAISSGIFPFDLSKRNPGPLAHSRWLTCANRILQRNAYFTPPKNLLICMLNDTKRYLRELALKRILKTRNGLTRERMREFIIPKINFEATTYNDLIDWQNCELSEPPILASISNDDLNQLIQTVPEMDLVKFPCHTQAVERHVKIVSESSLSVSERNLETAM
ncbi:hypothetical protein RN001_012403 [Aquatica leii]|uniref:Uncharacterized protein n=1 Tax=Aquatica leii TaxID=1421715 RepID=A0AAN7P648_9COLE|nr:hypothetical protein RN001_012403 [Aquatica leii]